MSEYRNLLWTNLLLLGYDKRLKQDFKSVPLTSDAMKDFVFKPIQLSVNQKFMESIVSYLLQLLDKQKFSETFRECFPPASPIQAKEFRNLVFKQLEHMKKDGELPHDLMIRRSYLDECRGERYERTLLALSVNVIKRRLKAKEEAFGGTKEQQIDAYKQSICALSHEFMENEARRAKFKQQMKRMRDNLELKFATLQEKRANIKHIDACSVNVQHKLASFEELWNKVKQNRLPKGVEMKLRPPAASIRVDEALHRTLLKQSQLYAILSQLIVRNNVKVFDANGKLKLSKFFELLRVCLLLKANAIGLEFDDEVSQFFKMEFHLGVFEGTLSDMVSSKLNSRVSSSDELASKVGKAKDICAHYERLKLAYNSDANPSRLNTRFKLKHPFRVPKLDVSVPEQFDFDLQKAPPVETLEEPEVLMEEPHQEDILSEMLEDIEISEEVLKTPPLKKSSKQILANDLAEFILGNKENEKTPQAAENPYQAFRKDAFSAKKQLQRTPDCDRSIFVPLDLDSSGVLNETEDFLCNE